MRLAMKDLKSRVAIREVLPYLLYLLMPVSAVAAQTLTLTISPTPSNTFDPRYALGAGVDGHEKGEIAKMLRPDNIAAMLSAGLKPLTYRLRTELAIEAWHWNASGKWSDPANKQGYWISDDRRSAPINLSYGYRLPRRGSTIDQANNDGYSRLDDGDTGAFWKSNPYLDERFTGEPNSAHPQWAVLDLGQLRRVNAVRLLWGEPYATQFTLQYAEGEDVNIASNAVWLDFPDLPQQTGTGGEQAVRLSQAPLRFRYLRVLMSAGSGTAPATASDVRDGLGYAIREIYVGFVDTAGNFNDLVRHSKNHNEQTVTYVSSTDPWHRAIDRDPKIEQPGFDRIFRSGLTNHLAMLTAVPLLYDTPENAAAEVRYLKSRGYPVQNVELGEEPEEQFIMPEDYGALFLQWAGVLRRANPQLVVGGPSLVLLERGAEPDPSWIKRFLGFLKARGRLDEFGFFSFEWYPFDDVCSATAPQLARAPLMLSDALAGLEQDGLSRKIPWIATEYGYSAFGAQAEVEIEGALLNAETVGLFLTLGGAQAYLYGYEPNELIHEKDCAWGNNMIFLIGEQGEIRYRLPTYHAARLLTQQWTLSSGGNHAIFPARTDNPLVTAYAVRRPDNRWAVMLINKDPQHQWSVRPPFNGPVDVYQYSPLQYRWKPKGDEGHPIRNDPPVHRISASGMADLPPYSMTILVSPRVPRTGALE
ncbi:MAG: discoidin domain-containing protein [Acidobacteriota bacterium]|nr:discoidin domain-containing protein [Acidobacteriota bacterium]